MFKSNLKLVSSNKNENLQDKKIKIRKGLILKLRADGRSSYYMAQIKVTGHPPILRSTKCSDVGEATKKAYDLDAQIRQDIKAGLAPTSKSFDKIADEFVEYNKNRLVDGKISQQHFELVVKTIRNYLIPYFCEVRKTSIGKISKLTLNAFREWLPNNSKKTDCILGSSTLRKYENILGALLKFAERKGYIKEMPSFAKTKEEYLTRPSFTKEQYRKMMRKLKEYIALAPCKRDEKSRQMMYYACALMSKTGLRPHELLPVTSRKDGKPLKYKGLRFSDIEWYVDKSTGKHSVDIYICPQHDKNGEGRTVPADKTAYFILAKLRDMTDERHRNIARVFDTDFRSAFPRFLNWAGIRRHKSGKNYSMYCLRHSYISWHIEDKPTSNPRQLGKVCGNSSATIERYYDKSEIHKFRHNFI